MNLFDLIILIVLALFLWLGVRRGLIMTLCGLVVTILALIGAQAAADQFSPYLASMIQPSLQSTLLANIDDAVASSDATSNFTLEDGGLLEQVLGSEYYEYFAQSFQQSVEEGVQSTAETVAATVAQSLAETIAWLIVYLVAFALIILLGKLLAKVLDLAAMLPGLHFLNKSLGGLLGLIKGVLIVAVLCSLGAGFGLIPAESVQSSALLKIFSSFTTVSL